MCSHGCFLLVSCPGAPAVSSSDSRSLSVSWLFSPGTLTPSPSPPPEPPARLRSGVWPPGRSNAQV